MDRRRFLGTTAGLAAAALWPGWLRRAFAEKEQDPWLGPAAPGLADGLAHARHAGKPLLVLVIPADSTARWRRGQAFGELINHGGEETLATLALAEILCAPMDDIRRLEPDAGDAEPLLVLFETDGPRPRVRIVDAQLPENLPRGRGDLSWEEWRKQDDAQVEARIAQLSRLVQRALAPDGPAVERRAIQARAALTPAEHAEVERSLLDGGGLELSLADRAAALVFEAAEEAGPSRRPALLALLAQAAAARLRDQPVPGSRWARSSGCGTVVEGAPELSRMVACGMGHVPAKSQRFLYFFSQSDGS
jgi:hypothetical protein